MDERTPHIDVRAVQVSDAPILHGLDNDFETDRIYVLRVQDHLLPGAGMRPVANSASTSEEKEHAKAKEPKEPVASFALELVETPVDPPLYRNLHEHKGALAEIQMLVRKEDSGFTALVDGKVVGAIFMSIDEDRSVARIQKLIIGRQYRRYKVGSLLVRCASDWGRKQKCWALLVEAQSTNFPEVQFYLRNGLEIWSICSHFYPPGAADHDVALFLGKYLLTHPEG